jgi:uncharacterized protein Yka (UPF0111/DUF47 family)
MKEAADLLLRFWPMLVTAGDGFLALCAMLWKISALVKDVISRLDYHTERQEEIASKIDKIEDNMHAIDTRVAVVENHPRLAHGR